MEPQKLRIADYTYELPNERIAIEPLAQRDASKLLVYKAGQLTHKSFSTLPQELQKGDLLVANDSKVIRARLTFYKETGARIEVFCLEPEGQELAQAMATNKPTQWKCYLGNAKRWKSGPLALHIETPQQTVALSVKRVRSEHDFHVVELSWDAPALSFGEVLEAAGNMPLPPYLNREATEADVARYQTVFAAEQGSVAAPTAGLHFTPNVLAKLDANGIQQARITLHVGAGTFKPVNADEMANHLMHEEPFIVQAALLAALSECAGRIVPVGTTSMRTLESLYWLGVKAIKSPNELPTHLGQWEAYELAKSPLPTRTEALQALAQCMERAQTAMLSARTGILIAPGYKLRMCDGLITNFHQPGSTLLLLVAALLGPQWRAVYDYALQNDFRFLSYGDSSLLLP